MASIRIDRIQKSFGTHTALQELSLDIADGEFVALLGPSGCGKTTLLRIIAGLERQSGGRVLIGDRDVSALPPRRRGLAMVFQNYAVFPHLTVADNIAFGLRMRGEGKAKITQQVDRAAALLHVGELLGRYPGQLSGGQRQRVAVARALAVEPAVLLMDEPLSNLDALLRLEMRAELKAMLASSGTTTLYVTHDQTEAMGLADRIAVMQGGRIEQVGKPSAIYHRPRTRFVGSFVGSPPMNFLRLAVTDGAIALGALRFAAPPAARGEVVLGLRAEDLLPATVADGFAFEMRVAEPLGSHVLLTGATEGKPMRVVIPYTEGADGELASGQTLYLRPNPDRLNWLDAETGIALETRPMTDAERREAAEAVLHGNDRGGYTVPTDRLYPFQWNWDSAFVAMGWAVFDEARAWREVERLLEGQWEDGLIPQIVFHAPSDDYFPGPDVWGVRRIPPTSGITQPPVLATSVRRLMDRAKDQQQAEAKGASIYPALLRNHGWWAAARDPDATGLVATLHPWETGMDNSPAWDAALDKVPTETTTPIRRRDTSHVDPAFRPRAIDYQRFIHLVDVFRDAGWDAARMLAASPFRIADIGINAILARAERDLLALARRFGTPADCAAIMARLDRAVPAIERLWGEGSGLYHSYDLVTGGLIPVGTSAGFLPLFGGFTGHAARLATTLDRWKAAVKHLVPSTDPSHPHFEPLRYWRGPVWAVVNWMIAEGFAGAGHADKAAAIRAGTRDLIGQAGFAEYFDPLTGRGIGGATFTWTAAIDLLLADPVP